VNESDLKKLLDTVTQHKQDTKDGNSGGIVGGLIAVVVFIFVVAIFAFQAWKSGKERAKLLHEKAVREEEAHRVQVDAQLAENAETAVELMKKVDELQAQADELEEKAQAERLRHEAAVASIQSATSWDQIDQLLGKNQ